MTYLRKRQVSSLPQLFMASQRRYLPLMRYACQLMEAPSELTRVEREQIGLLVSGLNACGYCRAKQVDVLNELGVERSLVRDLSTGSLQNVEAKLRVLYEYVVKLTLSMEQIRQREIDAVYAAGWSDEAVEDAVCVASLFAQLNGLASGLGFVAEDAVRDNAQPQTDVYKSSENYNQVVDQLMLPN